MGSSGDGAEYKTYLQVCYGDQLSTATGVTFSSVWGQGGYTLAA